MLNLENLQDVTGGDQALIESLLAEFIKVTDEDIANLQEAVAHHQDNQVTSLAHRIKGAAAVIGAEQLTRLTQLLENAGRSGQQEQYQDLLTEIENSYSAVAAIIRNR